MSHLAPISPEPIKPSGLVAVYTRSLDAKQRHYREPYLAPHARLPALQLVCIFDAWVWRFGCMEGEENVPARGIKSELSGAKHCVAMAWHGIADKLVTANWLR